MLLTEKISREELKFYIKQLYNYCLDNLSKIDRKPKIILKEDEQNSDDIFGKTGYYDPQNEEIYLFTHDRHAKDILRSLAHELVHHEQNCRGDTEALDLSKTASDPAYATNDKDLREMEREAFERGNMIFRDWCDLKKVERQRKKDKIIMSESKKTITENKNNKVDNTKNEMPYEELFKEKERVLKDRMNNHENILFQELMKKFINKD